MIPDKRISEFYVIGGILCAYSDEGREKAAELLAPSGYDRHHALKYLMLLDLEYESERLRRSRVSTELASRFSDEDSEEYEGG